MAIAACGISCNVCLLHVRGDCSSCGPATGSEAQCKRETQQRLLGAPCPILACSGANGVDHCLRDCARFPCEHFTSGPYPFSQGFLKMQQRRRAASPPAYAPDGSHLKVDAGHWRAAAARERAVLCDLTFFDAAAADRLQFRFLDMPIQIDFKARHLLRKVAGTWQPGNDPLLELVTVLYLAEVRELLPLGREIVGVRDLKEGHFFAGPHELRLDPLLHRFGNNLPAFRAAAERLGGTPMEMGEASYRLLPFPRLPLYYLLWTGDAEFKPRIQVLFDRSIETIFAADAIWALVNRVSQALVET